MRKSVKWVLMIFMLVSFVGCSPGNSKETANEPSLKAYGFTKSFDPEKKPGDTVGSYKTTDTLYYVVIARNIPKGTIIHQVWEYIDDGSQIEGNLEINQDIKNNYLGFNLAPNGSFQAGDYKITLTWTVDGVDGKLQSLAIALKD